MKNFKVWYHVRAKNMNEVNDILMRILGSDKKMDYNIEEIGHDKTCWKND